MGASGQLTLMAHVEFVLKDKFKELAVAQASGGGFLQAHGQALGQTGEPELSQGGFDRDHGMGSGWEGTGSATR